MRRPVSNEPPDPSPSAAPPCREFPARGTAYRPGVHAVVVTYQSRAQIAACIESLLDCVEHVVVVDNASSDGTAGFVAERYPGVELVVNRCNVGFACAVNQGIECAKYDTVLLVNPDCVAQPGAVDLLREHLLLNPDVGITAPRVLDRDGEPVVSVHPFETLASVLASRFGGSLVPSTLRRLLGGRRRRAAYAACAEGNRPLQVDWASGAFLAVRTELLEEIGGLDEGYFLFYEDEELCLRAGQEGASVVYLPAATVRHIGGASSGSDPAAVWPSLYASMLLFFARHRPSSLPALRATLVLRAGIGTFIAVARGNRERVIAWWRVGRLARRPPVAANGQLP